MTTAHDFPQLAFQALAHATAGDAHEAADLLTTIATNTDTGQMYGICCGFAEAAKIMLTRFYGDQVPKPGSGDMWVLEQLRPGQLTEDAAGAFSLRFIVAYCNGDKDMTLAMFQALLTAGAETFTDSVTSLLADAAGICRLAIEQKREAGE